MKDTMEYQKANIMEGQWHAGPIDAGADNKQAHYPQSIWKVRNRS